MEKKAVVLLSGGIDSSTTAAIAKAEGYTLYALTFDYHQRHRRELESAKMVAESLGVKKQLVINFDLREIGGSALTSEMEVPKKQGQNDRVRETGSRGSEGQEDTTSTPEAIPVTYVPARNTIFLSFALSWAEVLKAPDIFIGANAVDYSGYPDCRPDYLNAFEKMANLATKISMEGKLHFSINAPLLYMSKAEIIRQGVELGLDYSLTWSCYDPQKTSAEVRKRGSAEGKDDSSVPSDLPDFRASALNSSALMRYVPCGRCDSCIIRAKGFKEAGIKDALFS